MTQASKHNFLELCGQRYSCRGYSDQTVGRDAILQVIEAARTAPSACNRQPWHFLIVTEKEGREAIAECYNRDWIRSAGTFIICLGNHSEAWHRADGKDHTDVDISIATEHICLQAADLGLATCWVCNFDIEKLRKAFAIPENLEPIAIIPLGYPAKDSVISEKKRKTINDIVSWEKF